MAFEYWTFRLFTEGSVYLYDKQIRHYKTFPFLKFLQVKKYMLPGVLAPDPGPLEIAEATDMGTFG